MSVRFEPIKPAIGARILTDRSEIFQPGFAQECMALLDKHGVLVFPELGLNDEEQLAFNDLLGERLNFTRTVAGGDATMKDVYTVTLDPKLNTEPEYVFGTFFWHLDGMTMNIPPPKASVLSCRKTAPKGGQTEFASTYAAYAALPEEEKADIRKLRVIHSVTAAVREVAYPDELEPIKRSFKHEQPLVWTQKSGNTSMLIGYTADDVIGMSKAHGRALLMRLLEWTSQPQFTYRHYWKEGDLAIWDNCGILHRVVPYAENSGRRMHRTSVAGIEATPAV